MIKQIEKHDTMVWCDEKMDDIRKRRCLCLNCGKLNECKAAQQFLNLCIKYNTAFMMTCCESWEKKSG